MALKKLTRDHHNMHKRHLVIGDAMAVKLTLGKGRSSSQMAPICRAASAYVLASFCKISYRWVASGTGHTFPPATVPCISYELRPPVASEHVEPIFVSHTAGVSTCPLEQATQTGSSASTGDDQSEPESSCREATLPTSSLYPQSNLIRQVGLRWRCLYQCGHLYKGHD